MRVVIFGSGPSGLLAAHAARSAGVGYSDIDIYSLGEKSKLFGCQYLHKPIPGITNEDWFVDVSYKLVGSEAMYMRKVYGDQRVPSVSPEDLGSEHRAWDIRSAYDELWSQWKRRTIRAQISGDVMQDADFGAWIDKQDVVINTIPRHIWCTNSKHTFSATDIWAIGDAPELGRYVPFKAAEDNSVVCNGSHDVGWYRISRVFDHNTIEWPIRRKPPIQGIAKVQKPTGTDCDCWEGRVAFFGRYGEWKKGVLAHQVFDEAEELMINAALN